MLLKTKNFSEVTIISSKGSRYGISLFLFAGMSREKAANIKKKANLKEKSELPESSIKITRKTNISLKY